ncbi:sensor domain-containing protein [Streptomyces sp. NPDC049837]|uniref:sensor histidine kinase n=1 Tax=Streptomyces sp. NPDC049837 TaxID=3155277 RepID=UPI0034432684
MVRPFVYASAYALVYAIVGFPLAVTGFVLVLAGLLLGGVLSVTALGPWVLALTVRGALGLGAVQRRLARVLLDVCVEAPARRAGPEPGAFGWRRAVLGDRAGWRAVGCALAAPLTAALPLVAVLVGYVYGALFVLGPLVGAGEARVVTVLGGLALLALAPWLVRRSLAPHRALLAALLAEDPAARRIRALEETRAQAVEDAAATLRRIERDLHDGTQARLVGLGMHLTLIRELITAGADEERLLRVVDTARGNATQAVAELRAVVKGIHPPVLDQGLDAALATLAADAPLPVAVTVDLARRPSPALESLVYFCAAELLANAVKHSGASAVTVDVRGTGGELSLAVSDDGRGGAVPGAGSGLTGLLGRVRTVDGALTCDSPPGGPTVVTVAIPY